MGNLPPIVAMLPRSIISWLVAAAVVLPMVVMVLLGAGRMLLAMGDAGGQTVLDRLALSGGIVWTIDLVALLVAVGFNSVSCRDEKPKSEVRSQREE